MASITKDSLRGCIANDNAAKYGHCKEMRPNQVKELYKCVHGGASPPASQGTVEMCDSINTKAHKPFITHRGMFNPKSWWTGSTDNPTGVHTGFFEEAHQPIDGTTFKNCASSNNIQLGKKCNELSLDNLRTLFWCVHGYAPNANATRDELCKWLKKKTYDPFPPVYDLTDIRGSVVGSVDDRGVPKEYWQDIAEITDPDEVPISSISPPSAAASAKAPAALPAATKSIAGDLLALLGQPCATNNCADGLKCWNGVCVKKDKRIPYTSNSMCFGRDDLCKKGRVCRDTGRCGLPPKGTSGKRGSGGSGGIRPGSDCISGACPDTDLECRNGKCTYAKSTSTATYGQHRRPARAANPRCDGNLEVSAKGNCVFQKPDPTTSFGQHRHPARATDPRCYGDLVVSAKGNCVLQKPAEPPRAGWRESCATKPCDGDLVCSTGKRCIPKRN